ncbi:MAG: hypothetical protein U9Q06_01015 [Nanoarchaeota archaeon]|nr:hypothetical protein [Nanoarchaeota archaeon]
MSTKKRSVKKKPNEKKSTKRKTAGSKAVVEKLLLENFLTLQQVLANLTTEFKGLSAEISKLLTLFESSAKAVVEKQGTQIGKEDKAFLEKLDKLIDQNKIIAKGLTLMEERMRPSSPRQQTSPRHPLPPRQMSRR